MQNNKFLPSVNSPLDLKALDSKNLPSLSLEIADFLVENVSKTGGHLSPNLGVVDLTIALHRVFDSSRDRFIFDVGHQCYVHKILTGRKDKFSTLRQKEGLSGFLKPSESIHDAFVSGHASMSISAGLGMAHARTLKNDDYHIISIIGDGALTGGLAYEALNNAGHTDEPFIVILNDNRMSITENVGAVSRHLYKLRTSSSYLGTKEKVHKFLDKRHHGDKIAKMINRIKSRIKSFIFDTSFFEQMGFTYLGPIDGHDINAMTKIFERAKGIKKPVLIHVLTKKGKGYSHSEKYPDVFHGISKFDAKTGEVLSKPSNHFSNNFGDALVEIALENEKVCAITAAMTTGTGLLKFSNVFKNRFFDVGIAESHAITMSAGLSKEGLIPVCAMYSTFLQRGYDQLIHDVALQSLHVVFAIDRAGIVGDDGETHNGVFDIPMLLSIPNFEILLPSNYKEQQSMLKLAINEMNSPVVIRYPRGSEGEFIEDTSSKDIAIFNEEGKITVITYGTLINNIYDEIYKNDIKLIKINKIKNNLDYIISNITDKVIIVEDCVETGSLGQKILANSKNLRYKKLINTGDKFTKQATVLEVQQAQKISKEGILEYVKEAFNIE